MNEDEQVLEGIQRVQLKLNKAMERQTGTRLTAEEVALLSLTPWGEPAAIVGNTP